jgi:cytosine/adenosine deaminase-related metal-dependent hydrolase
VIALGLALLLGAAPAVTDAPLAIEHVAVVDVANGAIARDRFVVLVSDRIAAIGDATIVPRGARRLDGRGAYLVPGLVDLHVHLFNNASQRAPNDWALPMFVANGVTGVREMGARAHDMPRVRRWNDAIAAGEVVAPRVLAAGIAIRCGPRADVERQVAEIARLGAFVKVFSNTDAACWRHIAAAARARDIAVAGHVPQPATVVDAARDGLRSVEHLTGTLEACSARGDVPFAPPADADEAALAAARDAHDRALLQSFDASRCARTAARVADLGQVHVPTLVLLRGEARPADPARDPRWPLLRTDEQARWAKYLAPAYRVEPTLAALRDRTAIAVASRLHRAGVVLAAGTDAPMPNVWPGWSLHDELGLLVEAGLTPTEALRAATLAPARLLGIADETGSVAPGMRADLLLLDADPVRDVGALRNIRAVVLSSRVLDRSALQRLVSHE